MIIQKSKDKPLQFDANLEKIIFRTFEKRSKNSSCERTVLYVYLYDVYKKYLQFFDLSLTNLKSFYLKMNSDKIFEPDLELADAFSNLFFEIIMPSLIIMGYFLTTKKVKAVVVNDFE